MLWLSCKVTCTSSLLQGLYLPLFYDPLTTHTYFAAFPSQLPLLSRWVLAEVSDENTVVNKVYAETSRTSILAGIADRCVLCFAWGQLTIKSSWSADLTFCTVSQCGVSSSSDEDNGQGILAYLLIVLVLYWCDSILWVSHTAHWFIHIPHSSYGLFCSFVYNTTVHMASLHPSPLLTE